jgi:PDZ domain-containing protein
MYVVAAMHTPTTTRLINVLTADGSLPSEVDPDSPSAPSRRRRFSSWWVAGPLLVVALAALLVAAFLPISYYSVSPGSVRSAGEAIAIDGEQFPPEEGGMSYATVSIQQVTPLGLVAGWLDPTTDVRPQDEVLIGGDREHNRQVNAQLMDDSKSSAEAAAFVALGCDVLSGTGAAIQAVAEDLPVADHLSAGDTVVAVDGQPIEVGPELGEAVDASQPGDVLTLTVEDGEGTSREEQVEVSSQPDDPEEPLLGVSLSTRDLDVSLPLDVEIDSGQVGGPSAGLAFTLALLDELTPGSLTGGESVTATGTMDVVGRVGPVGGVTQKTAAVRRAGDTLFLVPPDEFEEAEAAAGDDLEVVAVSTLDEALAALEEHGGDVDALEESDICGTPG